MAWLLGTKEWSSSSSSSECGQDELQQLAEAQLILTTAPMREERGWRRLTYCWE
jgi:hypothetical protein